MQFLKYAWSIFKGLSGWAKTGIVVAFLALIVVASGGGESPNTERATSADESPQEQSATQEADMQEPEPTPEPQPVTLRVRDLTVKQNIATIQGKVTPADATVTVAGKRAKLKGRRFARKVKVKRIGRHSFDVEASADGYEDASATVTVKRKRNAAELAVYRAKLQRARELAQASAEQENALESAKSYLDYSGFSRQGLIRQLSSDAGEGYSVEAATWAADHAGADWKAEAVESAESYMDYSSFSRQGLLEQLTSDAGESFTYEEAAYAVEKVYR